MDDYYKTLGVAPHHSDQLISNEYKLLALKYHPDKKPESDKEGEQQMALFNRAYQVLSQERELYDIYYRSGLNIPYDVWKKKRPISHWKEMDGPLEIERKTTDEASSANENIAAVEQPGNLRKKFENYEI